MKALILSGGFATRARPISCTRPKTLFPIINKPLLQWIFERLAKNNILEVVLAVNYQTEIYIKQKRIPKCGLHIEYSRDPLRKPLGTGGPIKKAEKIIGHKEPFLVLNGDIFADLSYSEILKKHNEEKAVATVALHRVKDSSRYGIAKLAKDNHIEKFVEKPPKDTATTKLINAGVYVLSPKIFRLLPEKKTVSIEREIFPSLAEEGVLFGYAFKGLWMDIGKPEEYLQLNKTLLDLTAHKPKHKSENIKVNNPVSFDKGVSIEKKSVIGPYAVLGRNVSIKNNVQIRDSVIFPRTSIDDFSSISGSIIGEGVTIGKNVQVRDGCIIGDHAKVKDNVLLVEGVSICPGKEVTESILTTQTVS